MDWETRDPSKKIDTSELAIELIDSAIEFETNTLESNVQTAVLYPCNLDFKSQSMRRRSKISPPPTGPVGILNKAPNDDTSQTKSPKYMNRSDIKNRAIQVFYTEGHDRRADFTSLQKFPYFKVMHPNGKFRSMFDFFTVIWVLLLVYMIPFQIGFDWYELTKYEKLLMNLLDIWFAIDIMLNFRTGYIHHGTIIMNPKKIVRYVLS